MAKPGHRDKACWRARNAIGVGNVLKMNWRKISSEQDHCKVGNPQILPNSFDYSVGFTTSSLKVVMLPHQGRQQRTWPVNKYLETKSRSVIETVLDPFYAITILGWVCQC